MALFILLAVIAALIAFPCLLFGKLMGNWLGPRFKIPD